MGDNIWTIKNMSLIKIVSHLVKTSQFCSHNQCFLRNNIKGENSKFKLVLHSLADQNNSVSIRYYSEKPFISPIKESSEEAKKQAEKDKKKKALIPRVALLDEKGNMTVTTLVEANKLATRRGLKLVYLRHDLQSARDEYRMMTQAEYLKSNLKSFDSENQSEKKGSNEKKGSSIKKEKLLSMSSQIGEHDLKAKIKKITQWLEKRHEIRIAIEFGKRDSSTSENIFKEIEKEVTPKGRITQKRVTPDTLKFVILPPKESKTSKKETEDAS